LWDKKTNPNGFRISINKTYSSTWYANYKVYGDTLKEDYNVRQFFEKKFGSIHGKAGITKIELLRKINQLELKVYAVRPKAIVLDVNNGNFAHNVKDSIRKIVGYSKQIRIKVLQVTESEKEGYLVAQYISKRLEKRLAFRKVIRQTTQALQQRGLKGFKIQVSGRLNGAEIARTEWAREGRVPLQTLRADISYATSLANTIYGILGIKVWIFKQ
jgi:small subunit ribosomal protein S3